MILFLKKIRFLYLINVKWRKYSFGINAYIGRNVYMWAKNSITIGDNFYIGKYSIIECDVEIGNNVLLANRVALIGRYDHHYQQIGVATRLANQIRDKSYNWKGLNSKTIIQDDVWVGYGSIILSGVNIGQGSIIAAGSVVTKDVDSFSIYGGVPAKKMGDRFENSSELEEHIRIYNINKFNTSKLS